MIVEPYRHSTKVGNKGDVVKHYVLAAVAEHMMSRPDNKFRYVDTHSGQPAYRLGAKGEWQHGIGALIEERQYLPLLEAFTRHNFPQDSTYLGSTAIVAETCKRHGKQLVAYTSDTDKGKLGIKKQMELYFHTNSIATGWHRRANGFRLLERILKADPPEAYPPSLVFIDPPYREQTDWDNAIRAMQKCHERLIPALLWYPIGTFTNAERLLRSLPHAYSYEVNWAYVPKKGGSQGLKGCGVVIQDIELSRVLTVPMMTFGETFSAGTRYRELIPQTHYIRSCSRL